MLSRNPFIFLILLLTLAVSLSAQNNRSSALAQLHGPFWMAEGPSLLEALVDLNNDGRLDLLLRSRANAAYPDRMKAVISNSEGGYDQEIAGLQLPTGTRRVLAGEFNGDGFGDLIVETDASEPTFGKALLFAPMAGNGLSPGSFSLLSPLLWQLEFAEVADLEGDGDDDILMMLQDGQGQPFLLWLETLGLGAFSPHPLYFLPSGTTRLKMIAADLDGDGVRDAAFLTPSGIERFATNGINFSPLAMIPHGLPSLGSDTADLVAVDLENDGDVDFVVTESAAVGFQVLLDQGGTFVPGPVTPTIKSNPTGIRRELIGAGDMDGDGLLEIVFQDRTTSAWATDYGLMEIYVGATTPNPEVALSIPFDPPSGYALSTWLPRRIIDLDGDGWLDIVGDGGFIYGTGLARAPLQTLSRRGSLADADRDGDLDLLEPGLLRRNDGSGYFEKSSQGLPRFPTTPPAGFDSIVYVLDDGWAVADFDGDDQSDLLVSADVTPTGGTTVRQTRRLGGLPDGSLIDLGSAAAGQRIIGPPDRSMLVRDIDSDGDLDLLAPGVLWLNDGTNSFVADATTIQGYEIVEIAQFDADPGLEMLAHPIVSNAIGLFVLDPQPGGPPVLYQLSPSLTGSERVADLDDDGDLDVIYLDLLLSQIIILRNQGASLAPSWGSPPGVFSLNRIQVGDFDGDQVTDFILGDRLYRNQLPGNVLGFSEAGRLGYPVEQVADLDGDGDQDFLGGVVQMNRSFWGPAAGMGRQYGTGSPGSGDYHPILGFTGPLRSGSSTAAVRISNGLGGGGATLFVGLVPADQADAGLPGLTSYVNGATVVSNLNFNLLGQSGLAGDGHGSLPFVVSPAWAGLKVFMQAAFFDPGSPVFYTVTNGLELLFGN